MLLSTGKQWPVVDQWKVWINYNVIFFMLYFQKNASKHTVIITKTKILQQKRKYYKCTSKATSSLSMTLTPGKGAYLHNTVKNFNTLFFMIYFQINAYKHTFHQNENSTITIYLPNLVSYFISFATFWLLRTWMRQHFI